MRRIGLMVSLVALFAIGIVTTASAVPIEITYTADNVINAWFKNGGAPSSLGLGSNSTNWRLADSSIIDLDICTEYQVIWQLENDGSPGTGNPGGFLGQIESLYLPSSPVLSSEDWSVYVDYGNMTPPSDFDTLGWIPATEYAPNSGPSIWTANNSGSPITGISESAQWIWGPHNFADPEAPETGDSVYIKAVVHPVPEPGTLLLLGSGLAGLAGYGLRRRKRK